MRRQNPGFKARLQGSDPGSIVVADGLRKSFGAHEVVRNVSFTARAGSVTVIIGPSGSGKTTILRALNALEIPSGGVTRVGAVEVEWTGGVSSKRVLSEYRSQSAMVFQSHNLFPHKTAVENVAEGPLIVRKVARERVWAEASELLARVGLAGQEDKYPYQLSGGQQQRVGIARALAMHPKVVLFDEPTSALDPELVGDVLSVMRDLAGDGWTMIVVTHEIAFARQVADQVLFIDDGVVVESGSPADVIGNPRQPRTREFLDRILNPM